MADSDCARIVQDNSDEIIQKIQEAAEPRIFDPYTLLSDTFIQENTKFSTLDELLAAAGIMNPITSVGELYSDPVNEVVAANSEFPNVQEMLKQAGVEQMARQLKEQPGS
jgi:hypothetical protein